MADAPADALSETLFINNGKGSRHPRFSQGDFLFPLPKNISIDLCDLKRGFLYLKAPCGGFFQKPACDLFAAAQGHTFFASAVPFYGIDDDFKAVGRKTEKGFGDWLGSDEFPVFRLTGLPI